MNRSISAMVVIAAILLPTAAFAQAGNLAVPAGDALAQTPPADVTRQELGAAPPTDSTFQKRQELREDGASAGATGISRP